MFSFPLSNIHHFSENVSRVTDNIPCQEFTDTRELETNNLETREITIADQNKDNQPLEKTDKDDEYQFEIKHNNDEDVEANGASRNLPDDAKVFKKNLIFDKILNKKILESSKLYCFVFPHFLDK